MVVRGSLSEVKKAIGPRKGEFILVVH